MDTGLEAINYINFSALAYAQFEDNARDYDIGYILKNKLYSNTEDFKTSKLTLRNSSNPLRSWRLINFLPNNQNGLTAAVFQNPEAKESRCNIGMICSINKEYVYA